MSSTLLSLFSQIPDPRRGQGKMEDVPLGPILLFTVRDRPNVTRASLPSWEAPRRPCDVIAAAGKRETGAI